MLAGCWPKVRVLLTTPHLRSTASPYRDMAALVQYLPKDEFCLTVCSLSAASDQVALSLLQEHRVRYLVCRFRPLGGSVRGKPLRKKWQHLYGTLREAKTMYRAGPFDVQHSLDYVSHPFEALLARAHSVPYLFTQRNLLEGGDRLALWIKALLCARVIAISTAVKALLREVGVPEVKVRRIVNGIDVETIPFSEDRPRERILLAVGQIVRLKRYEDALQAFAALSQEFPEVRLRVVGPVVDQTYYEELQGLASRLGIAERVAFLGPREDVLSQMQQASVLLHCSRSEGLGWVLLEAMAVGLPVVSASFCAAPEVVRDGETGFLVRHGDTEGYVNAIRAVLTNPALARDLARRARLEVERKFSAHRMAEEVAGVYREVVREARGRR